MLKKLCPFMTCCGEKMLTIFYCRSDASRIFVSIGMDCFVEFSYCEAIQFLDKRISLFSSRTEQLTKSSSEIKGHIKLVLEVRLLYCFLFYY